TYTGKMGQFKRGAFRISTDLSLPIVPVTLRGSFERMHRNSFIITPGIIYVYVHMPIDVTSYLPDKTNQLISKTWNDINSAL
ncbi:MAG TPA: 1-acyl-sn-glycerol-3-phosphate acyltransferase, partial [Paludibacter sp.]|nr:1-acyl-sn-glycerol-3-phosphate acyltransferase [Paludibacter sp.]